MAVSGVFTIITNQGKIDNLLNAQDILTKRLYKIQKVRQSDPRYRGDPYPKISDVERTHLFFLTSHFKPFVSMAYEYNPSHSEGSVRFGNDASFNIPVFGEFFHDMVVHVKLGAVEAVNSDYWDDPVANPAAGQELIRYCEYPGQRLFDRVNFTVNNNPLDEYRSEITSFHQKFFVTPNKEVGWKRSMGQEVAKVGETSAKFANGRFGRGSGVRIRSEVYDGHQTPKPSQPALDMWIKILFWFNNDSRLSFPSICVPYGQRYITTRLCQVNELLQHQHAYDPTLDSPATNPVPVPNIDVFELWTNNIFVSNDIQNIYLNNLDFSLIRVHRIQTEPLSNSSGRVLLNNIKWPIETLYVGLKPTENSETDSAKMLDDWHVLAQTSYQEVDVCGEKDYVPLRVIPANDDPTLAELDTALDATGGNVVSAQGRTIEGFVSFFGLAGATNISDVDLTVGGVALDAVGAINYWSRVHGLPTMDPADFADSDAPTAAELVAAWKMPPSYIVDALDAPLLAGSGTDSCSLTYKTCTPTFDKLWFEAQGIPLYRNSLENAFYNQYLPFKYGAQHINTPDDCGALMVTFNLYPGTYQPSGHLNISRAREFYLNYTSATVGTEVIPVATLIVVAICINFLLITDGSATIRYAT